MNIEWLTGQVGEDERRITGCCHCGNPIRLLGQTWTHGDWPGPDWQGVRCPRAITGALPNPEPDQARREVAFKRAILAWGAGDGSEEAAVERGDISAEQYVTSEIDRVAVLRMLARVYEDRPGYREAVSGH